ncbi:MAG: hypothetical protein E7616_02955 [Ruminococcaceae bacterium]|nr:hypothetical protein [Oscillospiraceae bacterium]
MAKKTKKKVRFNVLDVAIILFIILLLFGLTGRILLDRRHSKNIEERTVFFTVVVSEKDAQQIEADKTLYTEKGEKLGKITNVHQITISSETFGDTINKYVSVSGDMQVKGYEDLKGVFYTSDGELLRVNTYVSLNFGQPVQLYINDIVENGQ